MRLLNETEISFRTYLIGALILGSVFFWSEYVSRQDASWVPVPAQRGMKMDSRAYRLLTFGHWPAALDSLTLRFLVEDTSYSHVEAGSHPLSFDLLDLATDLDPAFFDLYTMGANYLAVIRNDSDGALHLLNKGEKFRTTELKTWPDAYTQRYWQAEWYVPMLLGYVYLYEKHDLIRAFDSFSLAAQIKSAPQYLKDLSLRIHQPGGMLETQKRVLKMMIAMEKNPDVRKKLIAQFAEIEPGKTLND